MIFRGSAMNASRSAGSNGLTKFICGSHSSSNEAKSVKCVQLHMVASGVTSATVQPFELKASALSSQNLQTATSEQSRPVKGTVHEQVPLTHCPCGAEQF